MASQSGPELVIGQTVQLLIPLFDTIGTQFKLALYARLRATCRGLTLNEVRPFLPNMDRFNQISANTTRRD